MNNNWLKYLVALAAIMIAGSAAYFSVTGLGVLFSGAAIAVMIMASSLEFAKLVTATYLKQKWEKIELLSKIYLTTSVVILMLITSAGIFGYLSNAFQQQNLGLQKIERDIAVYQTQIVKNDLEISRYTTQLNNQQNIRNSQETNLTKQIDKDKSTSRVSQMIKSADKEINSISKRIDELTIKNNASLDSINVIKNNNIELEKEVGGFRFVAESFGVPLNSVVKFFIILIVIVFDPLAVALIISFNQLTMEGKKKDEDEKEPSSPEDLKNFVDETTRLHLTENDLKKLEETLLNPPKPNDTLKSAAEYYKMKTDIEREKRGELLAEMMKNDEELGSYGEPFDNTSDWDVTLMDGLEDEEPFFTEEEMEKILQEEPTEEEIQRNFSTIEPKTENILQEEPTTIVNNKILTTIEQHKKNGYKVSQIPEDDERMNIIGQNGNEGLHYDNEEDTSLEKNDEKKKLVDLQIPTTEKNVPTLESQDSDNLYWEKDDVNPNQVLYDLENNKVIISNDDITLNSPLTDLGPKFITKNVSNTRNRKNRL